MRWSNFVSKARGEWAYSVLRILWLFNSIFWRTCRNDDTTFIHRQLVKISKIIIKLITKRSLNTRPTRELGFHLNSGIVQAHAATISTDHCFFVQFGSLLGALKDPSSVRKGGLERDNRPYFHGASSASLCIHGSISFADIDSIEKETNAFVLTTPTE